MLELLFLLLPVAAGYGWFMGRNSFMQEHKKYQKQFQSSYIKGLSYILDNQQEKGVDELITTLTVSSESVETHFALAQLFRKRGQLDKALKVHQYLVEQAKLNDDDIGRAIYELAQDFVAAGLHDKAEAEYQRLLDNPAYLEKAIAGLLCLYQITREWKKGIELSEKYVLSSAENKQTIANFYCELAELTLPEQRVNLLKQALLTNPSSLRALSMLADILVEMGNHTQALECYIKLIGQDARLLLLYVDKIRACCHDKESWVSYHSLIDSIRDNQGVASAVIASAQHLSVEKSLDQAVGFLIQELRDRPNIKVFSYLMDLQQEHSTHFDTEQLTSSMSEMLQDFIRMTEPFRCNHCGHKTKHHHWQCPRCHHWETVVPVEGLTGE